MAPVEVRFFEKIRKEPGDGCWVWTGALNEKGYGKFWVSDEIGTVLAHRWMWEYGTGPIPEDAVIDHLCKNHACVRPKHLQPITQLENTARGDSVTAQNTRADACRKGHLFTPDNTYRPPRGGRQCRACMRSANRKYHDSHPDRAAQRIERFRSR